MTKLQALLFVAVLSIILLVLHLVAITLSLYFIFPWFDLVMHALGGAAIGLLFVVLFGKGKEGTQRRYYITASIGALTLSFVWECIEYFSGITFVTSTYSVDTFLDVGIGFLAAVIVARLTYRLTS